jgi:hypothetical protein
MFGDGCLTFREFAMDERVPLATIQEAVLEFLAGRDDAAVFGAQAVNAYVDEPRMTQDIDVLSPRADELAEELRAYLAERFHIALRIRTVRQGVGYRLYQVRKPQNRHLVDVRRVEQLPPCNRLREVLVATPAELINHKIRSLVSRRNTPKGMTDAADLRRLLLAFPELKTAEGLVADSLQAGGASDEALDAWRDLVAQEIEPDDDETGF